MAIQQKVNKEALLRMETKLISMLDLKSQYESIKHEVEQALKEILETGHFVLGANVEKLEREIAEYHNVKHAVSLASGTDALHLSLRALGIKEGDEVITSPFTFIATAEAIAYVGATPVFADIDSTTFNIDPLKIREKITPRTRAIIPVHLFGLSADMKEIMDIAREHDLKVIEDCAQAFGAKYNGMPVGSIGDTGCFSFYPSKNLGAYGDGGIMITNITDIYEKVRLLRNHGTTAPYKHNFIGYNSRLDEIQAAILRIKLRRIDEYNRRRGELARLYTSLVSNVVQCPAELSDRIHVYHQYTIRSLRRREIENALHDNHISSVVYYPVPLHLQEAFKYLGYKEGDFPESESSSREVLSLPIYPELEERNVRFIAETILNTFR